MPSTNAALLRGGVFEAIGKFLVHSIIHAVMREIDNMAYIYIYLFIQRVEYLWVGCIGLSEVLVEYLTSACVNEHGLLHKY